VDSITDFSQDWPGDTTEVGHYTTYKMQSGYEPMVTVRHQDDTESRAVPGESGSAVGDECCWE